MPIFSRMSLSILDRYIFRQICVGVLATTLCLMALIWLFQSLKFVPIIADRGLSIWAFFYLTGLLIPSFLAIIIPITWFLVILFVYYRLSNDQEISVMQAAGQSFMRLARPAILSGLLGTVLCYLLNLWLTPIAFHHFRSYQYEIRNQVAFSMLQSGIFNQPVNGVTIYVRSRDVNGILHDIMIEDSRTPHVATMLASSGQFTAGTDPARLIMFNGSHFTIDPSTQEMDILTFKMNTLDLSSFRPNDVQYTPDDAEMSLTKLLEKHTDSGDKRIRNRHIAEAFRRVSSPLSVLSFSIIAVLGALRSTYQRKIAIIKPIISICFVAGLLALGLFLQSQAARISWMVIVMVLVAITPSIIGWLILTKMGRKYVCQSRPSFSQFQDNK